MGYDTSFTGSVRVTPPLYVEDIALLQSFARECHEEEGPSGSYYCQWVPTSDGSEIKWDGEEKFYDADEWMQYIIDRFLAPAGYLVEGEIDAQGEDVGDRWRIVVRDNRARRVEPVLVWPDDEA